jgi:hypothetical protein
MPQTGSRSSAGEDVGGFVDIQARTIMRSLSGSMDDALYWIQAGRVPEPMHSETQRIPMTYLDVVFRYGAAPGENALRAIDGMREVYGVRRVQFNEPERTVRVEFDASRLKADVVSRLLRQAGIDVRERLELA